MKCSKCLQSAFVDWFDYQKHVLACAVMQRVYTPLPKDQKKLEVLRGEEQFKDFLIYDGWNLANGF